MTDNLWDENDISECRKCHHIVQVNARKWCLDCYNDRRCCVRGCENIPHSEGQDCCSIHELQGWREEANPAMVALWEEYVRLDETLPKTPAMCGVTDPVAADVFVPIYKLFGVAR